MVKSGGTPPHCKAGASKRDRLLPFGMTVRSNGERQAPDAGLGDCDYDVRCGSIEERSLAALGMTIFAIFGKD